MTSFMSDYVMTGLDSYWHLADRLVALSTFIAFAPYTFVAFGPVAGLAVVTIPLFMFACSNHAIRRKYARGYIKFHALWHLCGSAALVLTSQFTCPYSFIFDRACSASGARAQQWMPCFCPLNHLAMMSWSSLSMGVITVMGAMLTTSALLIARRHEDGLKTRSIVPCHSDTMLM